ncbi:phage tail terminator-like protein [Stutzerimonas kunmingensis]|uniref:phage tail terminator-like protein n=1 Tax=Stutzerimonas kunmingensis TaxID=1211807 RepID=UPI0028AD897C|nr:phage tail terminator-like protein [Stutzerimonas kunmingensis]
MSESKIHSALVSAYIASGVMPASRTKFEGKAFTPPTGQSWARLTGLPTGRAPSAQGKDAAQEWTGILVVDVYHPKNTGHAEILEDVDTLQSFFRSGGRIEYYGQNVLIRRTERSQIKEEAVWLSVSVSIYCSAVDSGNGGDGLLLDLGGPSGAEGAISSDADNRLALGSDQKLYVRDDLTPDPLAYYILAKG